MWQSPADATPAARPPLLSRDDSCASSAEGPAPRTRRLLSKDQWEELRPFIHRVYILENQSFKKLALILKETYGFAPTVSNQYENPWDMA